MKLAEVVELIRDKPGTDVRLEVNGRRAAVRREVGITTPLTVTDHPQDTPACHLEAVLDANLLKRGRNTLAFTLDPKAEAPTGLAEKKPCEVRKVNLEVVHGDERYPYWLSLQLEGARAPSECWQESLSRDGGGGF